MKKDCRTCLLYTAGKGRKRPEVYEAKKGDCDNQKYYVEYPLGAYGVAVFEF